MKKHKWYNEIISFAEGKAIQQRMVNEKWSDTTNPDFGNPYMKFRIKSEPKYIPFTFEDRQLFRGKWVRNKTDGSEFIIDIITKTHVNNLTYKQAFESLEFLYGAPFGYREGL